MAERALARPQARLAHADEVAGLTVVGALGIALGAGIGVGFFVVLCNTIYAELPLDEGERIVALENWDVEANEEGRRSLHDFLTWREEMRSVEAIAAVSIGSSPLITGDAPPQVVRSAAMTAAGFEVARVPPFLGRYLRIRIPAPSDHRRSTGRRHSAWHQKL